VGDVLGAPLVGVLVGIPVGVLVGVLVGFPVGVLVGVLVGWRVGCVGWRVGVRRRRSHQPELYVRRRL